MLALFKVEPTNIWAHNLDITYTLDKIHVTFTFFLEQNCFMQKLPNRVEKG